MVNNVSRIRPRKAQQQCLEYFLENIHSLKKTMSRSISGNIEQLSPLVYKSIVHNRHPNNTLETPLQ